MLNSSICERLNVEFPLVAFTHCRDVVVEVSKAGGFGVLGAAGLKPEQLEVELAWTDQNIDGRPYGVDLIVPTGFEAKGQDVSPKEMVDKVPEQHRAFVRGILAEHGIDSRVLDDGPAVSGTRWAVNMRDDGAMALLDVAFDHPISLIANALGTPPSYMLERGNSAGVAVAALVGAKEHAIKQVEAGVDGLGLAHRERGRKVPGCEGEDAERQPRGRRCAQRLAPANTRVNCDQPGQMPGNPSRHPHLCRCPCNPSSPNRPDARNAVNRGLQ